MKTKLLCRLVLVVVLDSLLWLSPGAKAYDIVYVAPPVPIHHWAMEEGVGQIGTSADGQTTADSGTPGGNPGTIYGLTWAAGLNGTGACLDQERDNWGEAVDIPTLHGEITGSFTVEAYIKAESWNESWQNSIFSNLNDDGSNRTGFQLRAGARNDQEGWDPTKAVLGFVIGSRDDITNAPIWQTLESSLDGPYLELDTEYHVMGVYDADTGEMSIYVDGVKRGSKTQMTTYQDSAQISEIGRDPMTTQRFDGLIDEVKIYDSAHVAPYWKFPSVATVPIIENITATASSEQPGMVAQNTVNGSGLTADDSHSVVPNDMWLSTGAKPDWIQYEFDEIYTLDIMWIWNSNQATENLTGFGAKDVTIEYSTDGTTWTALEGVPEFAQAPGMETYMADIVVDFGEVMAKFVKLTINDNWGDVVPQTGLSEVRFFYVPDREL